MHETAVEEFGKPPVRKGSLGEILDANRGIGPGFDLMRLALSMLIVIDHCYEFATGHHTPLTFWHPAAYTLLGLFFALSGFLVTGSAERTNSLKVFLSFRAFRLVPALAVEVFVSALLIGPFVTSLPFMSYIISPSFIRYFGNILGHVQTTLPGVFGAPADQDGVMNINLWTLKPEFVCYLVMSLLLATSSLKKNRVVIMTTILFLMTAFISVMGVYDSINEHFRWHLLVLAFLSGSVFYLYRYIIPYSMIGAILCIAISIGILQTFDQRLAIIAVPLVAYATVCIGMTKLPLPKIFKSGDYSYGIYLYGYPLSQLIMWVSPVKLGFFSLSAAALVASFLVAALSWHFVEKPVLALRKKIFGKSKVLVHS
ncbi:acyltransferase family protein [Novosphingobium sp.]|uniref:acyltransferase family protein n=1 Tax=Novosphingobium sp. TaxID=1874826 RepID=UPI003D1519F2